ELDRVFDVFGIGRGLMTAWAFGGRRGLASRGAGLDWATWSPQVEVFRPDDRLVIRADLPGLSRDDVQVEVTDDAVTIRGERRQEHEERREGDFQSERSYGSFLRSIPLPEGVAADQAAANFHDGVLEVTMPAPRRETRRVRRLEVKG
ncbi:MAG TPA: Hsp20/alpha crystallin family protein, partial [Isosphaeraceae bacterium]|nr:Hsp20/alpha crystallin family protein [Isosphaeraceae bacterium]